MVGNRSVLLNTGLSKLEFFVHPIGAVFKQRPGVYAFAANYAESRYSLLYIGQTVNLDQRVGSNVASHEKYKAAIGFGANVMLVRLFLGPEQARIDIETALLNNYAPPLNLQ